jgi:hypothetical protein
MDISSTDIIIFNSECVSSLAEPVNWSFPYHCLEFKIKYLCLVLRGSWILSIFWCSKNQNTTFCELDLLPSSGKQYLLSWILQKELKILGYQTMNKVQEPTIIKRNGLLLSSELFKIEYLWLLNNTNRELAWKYTNIKKYFNLKYSWHIKGLYTHTHISIHS